MSKKLRGVTKQFVRDLSTELSATRKSRDIPARVGGDGVRPKAVPVRSKKPTVPRNGKGSSINQPRPDGARPRSTRESDERPGAISDAGGPKSRRRRTHKDVYSTAYRDGWEAALAGN